MLCSANFPTGGFSYSQGLESAIEKGAVSNITDLEKYLRTCIEYNLVRTDLPLLKRLYLSDEKESFRYWSEYVIAIRNTKELRDEEKNKGQALKRLYLQFFKKDPLIELLDNVPYLSVFARFCNKREISIENMMLGFTFCFIENQCMAAIRLLSAGQTQAWTLIDKIKMNINDYIQKALLIEDEDIGSGLSALTIMSVLHERQYSRLFRS